ncbi:MAG: hypothetical protein M1822_008485 [Bathelium mastoideum]|nr:MAG: hypothetical protein M1822_008485 [Bathelium mastoideum]
MWAILATSLALLAPAKAWTLPKFENTISVSSTSPYSLSVSSGKEVLVRNSAILTGNNNYTAPSVSASESGSIVNHGGRISTSKLSHTVFKVEVNTTNRYVGARFSTENDASFYGVWEYPWYQRLDNANITFELEGVGNSDGVNWDNARAPFFFTTAGYGVYTDTLEMGSYDFSTPGQVQYIFNSSSLVYYIILPESAGDFKSILSQYTALSAHIEMPADTGYGPTFWSDDFEEDFHAGVHNAQENYYDVVNHLYNYQIHATSMFADRPYGTGNSSFGNFDFDPIYYPTPKEFIANLSAYGFDFQVWVANRAFLDTELFNVSEANGWLFPGIDPVQFLGPALNLSIPAAYNYFKERLSYFPSVGVKGYKIDRGEEGEMPVYEQNIQQTLFEQLCYESMVEKWGASHFYNFARNAVDRSRARTWIWNGDSHSNFSGLAYSVASGIRAGLVGFPVWSSDTGGYVRGPNDPTEELWARWMWFSTFSPVYELMLGTNHTPYYPPYTSNLVSVLKDTAHLHHSLLPYIKSYTYQATQNGLPIIRALFLEHPEDQQSYGITDEYFFGEQFFVAPIVNAGGSRKVYFPGNAKNKYLEYFNKTAVYTGGSTASISLSVASVPAFVVAGAIVPRGDILQANNKWTENWKPYLEIEVFPSFNVPRTSFTYFNGDTGKDVEIVMMSDKKQGTIDVSWGAVGISGTLVLYSKQGQQNSTLVADGGTVRFHGVQSLFAD